MFHNPIKVSFFIKKSKLLKNGQAPIYCRIISSDNTSDFGIRKSVLPDFWVSDIGLVNHKFVLSKEINRAIENIRLRVTEIEDQLVISGQYIDSIVIKEKLFESATQHSILEVFSEYLTKIEKLKGIDVSPETVQKYKSLKKHLERFIKKYSNKDDYPLNRFNIEFIEELEFYFKVDRKISHNTTTKYLQNFNRVIKIALKKGWLRKNPFDSYSMKLKKVEKDCLEIDELTVLINKKLDIERLDKVRDVFVFCCYTGLAFTDVKTLKKKHIIKGMDGRLWIKKKRKKTKIESSIPLLKNALKIIDKYKSFPEIQESDLVLPVNSNQNMNAYLKEIAIICGIKKNMRTHLARHTFATTVALENGVSMEATSKMLGHSNISMTEHYARKTDLLVSRNFDKLEQAFG